MYNTTWRTAARGGAELNTALVYSWSMTAFVEWMCARLGRSSHRQIEGTERALGGSTGEIEHVDDGSGRCGVGVGPGRSRSVFKEGLGAIVTGYAQATPGLYAADTLTRTHQTTHPWRQSETTVPPRTRTPSPPPAPAPQGPPRSSVASQVASPSHAPSAAGASQCPNGESSPRLM